MSKGIIPKFMAENPNDTFQFLMPLKLKLDEDNFGNSHYEVVVKNLINKEIFTYLISPELLFTHFQLGKSYKNGEETKESSSVSIFKENFIIDTSLINHETKYKLKNFLEDNEIGKILGWSFQYLNIAKNVNCHKLTQNNTKIIIPHYVLGIYYYFRFTELREASLTSNIESLYILFKDNPLDAKIVLPKKRNDIDAAFIYRYATQKNAKNEFDNIGRHILNYLKWMRDKNLDNDLEDIHLNINFPTKEKFNIETRVSKIINETTKEEFYYVHEITNDNSNMGFNKLTKIIEEKNIIPKSDSLDNLPSVDKEIPNDTTDILEILDANKKYTHNQRTHRNKVTCNSLNSVIIEQASITKDVILDILKIYQEQQNDDTVNQSTTESSSKGDKKTRKISVSSEYFEERIKNPLKEIDNFVVFKQYINFLQTSNDIENFQMYQIKEFPKYFIKNKNDKEIINPKCRIKRRMRQYLSLSFKYKKYHVGLLELENNPSSATSSWVIISTSQINNQTFEKFIKDYAEENLSIPELIEKHLNANPKLTKKNHEREENLTNLQLINWCKGLLSKIYI